MPDINEILKIEGAVIRLSVLNTYEEDDLEFNNEKELLEHIQKMLDDRIESLIEEFNSDISLQYEIAKPISKNFYKLINCRIIANIEVKDIKISVIDDDLEEVQ